MAHHQLDVDALAAKVAEVVAARIRETPPVPDGALLTTREAAAYLRMRPNSLEVARSQGRGPRFLRLGRQVRYEREELDRFIGAQPRLQNTGEVSR
jgi:hypothetical protein